MEAAVLNLSNISVQIAGSPVLNGVSLKVKHGETIGIIGPNGSGKTTLFNTISGFVPVGSGRISVCGTEVTKLPAHKRARLGLGRVFQNFGIFREMSLLENLVVALEGREGRWWHLVAWSKVRNRFRAMAMESLAEVGLKSHAQKLASSLSGGQMRLLEIARTRLFGAEVFLLDEPTAGVSPKMKQEVGELILRLKAEGKTVLVIEHDMNFIQRFCDRILVLDTGKIVLDGSPEEIRRSALLHEIYFGNDDKHLPPIEERKVA